MTALRKGFTLIELLIVIAILGVLAVVVLVAINPVQQLARTRDAGRISTLTQLGHAVEAFFTANGGTYPVEDATWIDQLVNTGEISAVPNNPNYNVIATPACTTGTAEDDGDGEVWCYDAAAGPPPSAMVNSELEADSNTGRCAGGQVWTAYDAAMGRGGLTCASPAAGGAVTWLD